MVIMFVCSVNSHLGHVVLIATRSRSRSRSCVCDVWQLTDGVLLALAAEGHLRSLAARRCEQFTDTGEYLLTA